jgi:hypothetical protein
MPAVEVLKFGSAVLRSSEDLHVAVDEIYRVLAIRFSRAGGGVRI